MWFTGLSGSGKSTLAAMVAAELRRRGVHVETLDGDEIRKHLSKGLGFSKEDRDANVRRVGFVARLVTRSGGCAIAAAISPYRDVRDEVRQSIGRFCEVYCECPLDVLSQRDRKGLYEKALRGEIKNFTGVDDPYEAPQRADVHLRTHQESAETCAERIVHKLESLGYIPDWSGLTRTGPAPANALNPPYGGELVDALVPAELVASARAVAAALPAVPLSAAQEQVALALAKGIYSPVHGFMGSKDYLLVQRELRLEAGTPWPVPLLLSLPVDFGHDLGARPRVSLVNSRSEIVGTLDVEEQWSAADLPPNAVNERSALGARRFLAGKPTMFGDAASARTAKSVREELTAGRRASVTAFSARGGLGARELRLIGHAAAISDALVILRWHEAGSTAAVGARLVETSSHQVEVDVPYPQWTAERARLLELIVAKNLGAHRVMVKPLSDAESARVESIGRSEVAIDAMPYPLEL